MALGADSSPSTKPRSSLVGMLARLSWWRRETTGWGPGGFLERAISTSAFYGRRSEVRPNRILGVPRVADLEEQPTTKATMMVHRRHPQCTRRFDLCGL